MLAMLLESDIARQAGAVTEDIIQNAAKNTAVDDLVREFVGKAGSVISSFVFDLIAAGLILLIGFRLVKYVVKTCRKVFEKAKIDTTLQTFLLSFISIALKVLVIFSAVTCLGVAASSVIALVGSAGLAIVLSLQGSLGNIAGGVVLLLLKPFAVGDYIKEENTGKEGTVKAIGLVFTTIATIDNKIVMVPNGNLAATTIINYTHEEKRLVEIFIGVEYSEKIEKVKKVIEQVIEEEPARLAGEPVKIFVHEFADSSINMGIRYWVKTEDYWPSKWRFQESLKKAFDEYALSIPFPQLDVHVSGHTS